MQRHVFGGLTRRSVATATWAGAIGAALAACAPGGSASPAGDAGKSKQPVTLQWQSSTASGDQTRQKNWDLLLDRFQERNPHITVQRAYLPSGEHYDKVVVGAAGGSMPDLFSCIVTRVQSWGRRTSRCRWTTSSSATSSTSRTSPSSRSSRPSSRGS